MRSRVTTIACLAILAAASVAVADQPNPQARAQWPPGISVDWPEDPSYWSADELQGLAAELQSQVEAGGRHVAAKPMLVTRTHAVLAVHRDATGTAEQHGGMTDYLIITSGEGILVLGGEIVDRKEIGPGEYRGASIEGGRKIPVKPGDQIDIPPNMPHHVLVESGKSITYLIVKINIGMYPWGFMK